MFFVLIKEMYMYMKNVLLKVVAISLTASVMQANSLDCENSLIASPRFASTIEVRGPIIIGVVYGNNKKPARNRVVTVYIDKRKVGTVKTNKHGVWSYAINGAQLLQDRAHLAEAVVAFPSGSNAWTQAAMFYVQATRTPEATRSGNVSTAHSVINFPFGFVNTPNPVVIGSLLSADLEPVADEVVNVEINGVTVGAVTSDSNGVFSFQVGTPLSEGNYTVGAHCVQSDVDLTTNDFIVDLTPPAAPVILDPQQDDVLATNSVIISGTTESLATVTTFVDGNTFGDISYADELGNWSIEYVLDNGAHSVTAQATDLANNTGVVSAATNFTIDA